MNKKDQSNSTIGPIIGSLIVIIILIIAALYVWGQHLDTEARRRAVIEQANSLNGQVIVVPINSTSTAPADIQNDLNASPNLRGPAY